MIEKIKMKFLRGAKLAQYYENKGDFDKAYEEYFKIGNHKKAGEILEKTNKCHEAANFFISRNEIDLARRAIEICFIRNNSWEVYELDNGEKIKIEDWLKQKRQTRRFVRYVKYTETLNNKGIPVIIVLADKLKKVLEYKGAADLYLNGFNLINKDKEIKAVKNEVWLRYAAEYYSKVKLYEEAAKCMKDLIVIEVNIGELLPVDGYNPFRDYLPNLKLAKEWNFLAELIDLLGDFDPFNISSDLINIGEYELSIKLFFKFYGRVIKKKLSDDERERRNKKIQFCLSRYVTYYTKKKEYLKAAEIALLDSQKEIAADLFKKAREGLDEENFDDDSGFGLDEAESEREEIGEEEMGKCPTCGEIVEPDCEICPSCNNVLNLTLCVCGEKIKPQWKKCPACHRIIEQPADS